MSTGLDGRHRDKDGEISHKHGNTLVSTLRNIYGQSFAPGFQPSQTLDDVLKGTHEPSLSQLRKDHGEDRLGPEIVLAKLREMVKKANSKEEE